MLHECIKSENKQRSQTPPASAHLQHFALAGQHRSAQLRGGVVQQQAVRLLLQLDAQGLKVEAQACPRAGARGRTWSE